MRLCSLWCVAVHNIAKSVASNTSSLFIRIYLEIIDWRAFGVQPRLLMTEQSVDIACRARVLLYFRCVLRGACVFEQCAPSAASAWYHTTDSRLEFVCKIQR